MAWGFEADCRDCGHHWEGIQASVRIGLWSWYGPPLEDRLSLFCPRCYYRLYYPKSVERAMWRQWYEGFLASGPPSKIDSGWLASVLERVNASFTSARWYVPKAIDLGEVLCPGCNLAMVPGADDGDRLICPQCDSNRPVLTGFSSHVNLAIGEDGFV